MSKTRREDARRARTLRYSRVGATALALSLMISGPVASASADTVPEEPPRTLTIKVEVPPRQDIPTESPSPSPTADAGQGNGLAGTGMDGGLLALLVALGVVAVGSGTVIASRRRAQSNDA